MGRYYARAMFGAQARSVQERYGSKGAYERMAASGPDDSELGVHEAEFISLRDTMYVASVTEEGWPYVQHRGGPPGFVRLLDARNLAFADYSGNRQFITAANLRTGEKLSLFFMDYANKLRLKLIGRGRVVEKGTDTVLERRVAVEGYAARIERVLVIEVVGYDWNCNQHIVQRWSASELKSLRSARENTPG